MDEGRIDVELPLAPSRTLASDILSAVAGGQVPLANAPSMVVC